MAKPESWREAHLCVDELPGLNQVRPKTSQLSVDERLRLVLDHLALYPGLRHQTEGFPESHISSTEHPGDEIQPQMTKGNPETRSTLFQRTESEIHSMWWRHVFTIAEVGHQHRINIGDLDPKRVEFVTSIGTPAPACGELLEQESDCHASERDSTRRSNLAAYHPFCLLRR